MDHINTSLISASLLQARHGSTETSKAVETAKEFEAVFLTQFVDEMLKTAGATAFGDEHQSEMWRSFMSEAVAKHLVEQGGVGLSASVNQAIDAYAAPQDQTPNAVNGKAENDHS